MANDNLVTIRAAVRAALAGDATSFPDAMVDEAVAEATADISRLAPLESIHVEVLHNRTVNDDNITATDDTWVSLNNHPIDPTSAVVVKDNATDAITYVQGTDYLIDYVQGKIYGRSQGDINGAAVNVDYELSLNGIDLSTIADAGLIAVRRVEWIRNNMPQQYMTWSKWGDILWLETKEGKTQVKLTENDIITVYYHGEYTPAVAGTPGDYPDYMDEVVVKGAIAYTLLSKHRERNLNAVAQIVLADAAINLADADQDVIDTAFTASDDAMAKGVTAAAAVGTAAALMDDAILLAYGATSEPIDRALAALDGIDSELNGIDFSQIVAQADLSNTALDKIGSSAHVTSNKTALDTIAAVHGDAASVAADLARATLPEVGPALEKLNNHLVENNSRSADEYLDTGDAKIDAVGTGFDPAEKYATYAQVATQIARIFGEEGQARIGEVQAALSESNTRIALGNLKVSEGNAFLEILNIWVAEATQRIGEANARTAKERAELELIATRVNAVATYIKVAEKYFEAANGYGAQAQAYALEAESHFKNAQLELEEIDRHVALGALYLNMGATYHSSADRESQIADRFLLDGRERWREYKEVLRSKVEMAATRAQSGIKQVK